MDNPNSHQRGLNEKGVAGSFSSSSSLLSLALPVVQTFCRFPWEYFDSRRYSTTNNATNTATGIRSHRFLETRHEGNDDMENNCYGGSSIKSIESFSLQPYYLTTMPIDQPIEGEEEKEMTVRSMSTIYLCIAKDCGNRRKVRHGQQINRSKCDGGPHWIAGVLLRGMKGLHSNF